MKTFFFIILIAGIGNTVLRTEIEDPVTLYRLLAPLGLIAVFSLRPMFVLKALGFYLVFFAYNFVLATAYGGDYSQFFPSIVHYLYIFTLLILFVHMRQSHADFDASFIQFVRVFYVFLLANLVVEMAFGSGTLYPNIYVDESDEKQVRAFFWNQNDLAVVLCIVAWMALTLDRFRGPTRIFVVVVTIFLLYYNDSKAALISFLFISLPVGAVFRICAAARISPRVWFGIFSMAAFSALAVTFILSDIEIAFANDTYTLGDLLIGPIGNIFALQSSGADLGSINNRTDAAIFDIIEYLRTFGFGLGAGGSWLVLTLPQYELGGAKSPHNALLQFVVDFGYPVLLGYLYLVFWAVRKLFTYRASQSERLKVMAILSFPMLGLSQSGAIVTNYFFWAAVFFIALFGGERVPVRRRAARARAAPASSPPAAQAAFG
ncbi:MAG: O-antigen ligase family protein [Vicinamibacterales bacterium]